jgi:hypothetical protein
VLTPAGRFWGSFAEFPPGAPMNVSDFGVIVPIPGRCRCTSAVADTCGRALLPEA